MSENNNDENSNDSEQIKATTKKFLISKFSDNEIEINRKKHKTSPILTKDKFERILECLVLYRMVSDD